MNNPGRAAVFFLLAAGCLGPIHRYPPAVAVPRSGSTVPVPATALLRLPPEEAPDFLDDLDREDLGIAVRASRRYFEKQPSDRLFHFGPDAYNAREMAEGMALIDEWLAANPPDFGRRVRDAFWVYRSTGAAPDGNVVFSAYYEHDLDASLTRTTSFTVPLYGRPADVEEIALPNGEKQIGRRVGGNLRPYWSREDIDSGGRLAGRNLEIAWAADPLDVFFLQVQGSGWLRLPNGERLRIRYAGNNGLPYRSVGGAMIERGLLSRETFSREAMKQYLRAHAGTRQSLLNINPRYVFFQIDRSDLKDAAFGSLNVPLTPRRSIATDPAVYPPGALAWMETDTKNKTARFVVNQDEGGAIKGPGRVDYFVGGGAAGESFAVGFWEKGRVYFLAKRRGGTERGAR